MRKLLATTCNLMLIHDENIEFQFFLLEVTQQVGRNNPTTIATKVFRLSSSFQSFSEQEMALLHGYGWPHPLLGGTASLSVDTSCCHC